MADRLYNRVNTVEQPATPDVSGRVTTFVPVAKSSVFSISANDAVTDTDGYDKVAVTAASDVQITIPLAANNAGRELFITKVDTGTGNVVLNRSGSDTINGLTSVTFGGQYGYTKIMSYGTNWLIMDDYEVFDFNLDNNFDTGNLGCRLVRIGKMITITSDGTPGHTASLSTANSNANVIQTRFKPLAIVGNAYTHPASAGGNHTVEVLTDGTIRTTYVDFAGSGQSRNDTSSAFTVSYTVQ